MTELRTYVFLDNLQPQLAAFIGTTARGFLPVSGVASMFVEIAPGIAINRVMDIALKATSVQPAYLVVERAFGLLEIHENDKGQVLRAGEAILDHLGLTENGRIKPKIVTDEIIRGVEPYHAQLLNRVRYGSMLIPGDSLFIFETVPAGYVTLAANEAEKTADISIIDIKPFGAFGRLYLGGQESEIDSARAAALQKINELDGVET